MTPTQQIFDDALTGGFVYADGFKYSRTNDVRYLFLNNDLGRVEIVTIHELLLRPDFWQAVGKTRGWEGMCDIYGTKVEDFYATASGFFERHIWHWHNFIDHRAEGLSIDEALQAIQ
jgi:hypothetical protein